MVGAYKLQDLLTDGRLQTVKEELQRRLNEINKSPQLNYRWGSSSARENGVPNGDGKPIVKVTSRKWPLEQGEDIPMDINDTYEALFFPLTIPKAKMTSHHLLTISGQRF